MTYVSFVARILANAESLNMVESVGNVARHRRAPVVIPMKDGQYVLIYAPAISGESLGNSYQRWLVQFAKQYGLPLCSCCEDEFFIKHGDFDVSLF